MGVKIRISKGKYYIDIYHHGRRWWESTKIQASTDAKMKKDQLALLEVIRAKREMELIAEDWQVVDKAKGKVGLAECVDSYASTKSPKHLARFVSVRVRAYGDIPIRATTPAWLEGFKDYLSTKAGINPTTASSFFAVILAVLRKAHRDKIIQTNPGIYVSGIKKNSVNKIHLTTDEIDKLIKNGPLDITKRAFIFSCMTGLRISDLATLTWGGIRRTGENPCIEKRQQKTKEVVTIPLHQSALSLIEDGKLHSISEPVFPGLKPSCVPLIKWAAESGIQKHVGWHTARHTFAVLSLEGGADIYTVSKLLGHANLVTTQAYAKATTGMKRKAIDGLPDIHVEKRG